ncbi:RibD family protein [Ferroplasma acidiphilum]|uniref:Bacterial bifunctional deaminase-reductase C-terminal domain-containing protein n=1 Tax=Ferroplasma acidiphilum TaxID=74969 RepID=A0A7K4FQ21_9ARCH|nr:dihydrofolate reductase family protein [Ferroplasma acidiphilum]NOL61112.1 hypothetical protein [Ferroplasma acidiphilum]
MIPYIIINVAMSINGKISAINGRYRISNDIDINRVMEIRKNVDGVLLGANSVKVDNPVLNYAKNRIILDEKLRLNDNYNVFDGKIKSYIFSRNNKKIKNAEMIILDDLSIPSILKKLYDMGIKSILVEGGSNVINQFIDKKIFDEFYIFINPGLILDGIPLFKEEMKLNYKISMEGDGLLLNIKDINNF